jgi:predicted aspartyl protease
MATLSAGFSKAGLLLALLCASLNSASAGSPSTDSGPDLAIKEFRFLDLTASLRTMAPGPEHDYFAGVLANAENRIDDSIRLLNSVLPGLEASQPDRASIALQTLADDYTKTFRYGEAARVSDELLAHFSSQLTREQRTGTADDAAIRRVLRDAPAQTISWNGPVELATERNPLNSLNLKLTVNGISGSWLVDTGANFSVASESFAKRLGLKPLPGVAQTQAGLTGIENALHVALLPALELGGTTLHNVVIMILSDASLNVNLGKHAYQIQGIIGYPVLQALGSVTFHRDGVFEARDKTQAIGSGARMYMKELDPIIECEVKGAVLPFSFDTGASSTTLFVHYYQRFRKESANWKKKNERTAGAGGIVKRTVYVQPEVRLGIGDKTVVLKNVSIFAAGTGTDTNELYGNLGQDVPADFASFTLDFRNMTFSLGAPVAAGKTQ